LQSKVYSGKLVLMSKVFRFFCFILPIIILTLALFTIKAQLAFADRPSFEIIQDPQPFTINKKEISITVKTADNSDFFVEPKYSFAAWTGQLNQSGVCTRINFRGLASDSLTWNTQQITAKFNIPTASCAHEGDTWFFRIWVGDGWDFMGPDDSSSRVLEQDYSFVVAQPNGNIVNISAKNPTVYQGQLPTVIISNVPPGADYTFWWEKDQGVGGLLGVAGYYSSNENKVPGHPLELQFKKPSGDKRKLCMEYGHSLGIPWGNNNCNIKGNFVEFIFKPNESQPSPPSGTAACEILPSANAPLNSDVNMQIKNLPAGTAIRTFVLDKDNNILANLPNQVDNSNSVSFTLLPQATAGIYHAITYFDNPDNIKVCNPDSQFSVGNTLRLPPVNPCGTPEECSGAGGKIIKDCNEPNNPGIPTAIGCIHTSPAVFVKDLLTFLLGISGGLAFLMMLIGAFQMLTSAGNPETLHAGRERLTSAVIGLLIVIFAVLLLQIIGLDILRIPGFGR